VNVMPEHPEKPMPTWQQDLVRRRFEQQSAEFQRSGVCPEEATERAMWDAILLADSLGGYGGE
jgi:hypothetical protein